MTLQIELKEDVVVRMGITPRESYLRIMYKGIRGYDSTYLDMHVVKSFGNVCDVLPAEWIKEMEGEDHIDLLRRIKHLEDEVADLTFQLNYNQDCDKSEYQIVRELLKDKST
jgi:hypothetical protein